MRGLMTLTVLWGFAGLAGCGGCGGQYSDEPRAGGVDFAARDLTIDRLGQPVLLPVSVGSRPSPENVATSDAAVVSVLPDGRVVGHRNGSADLRTRGGGVMKVLVKTVGSIRLEPSALALQPGNEARLRVLADGGSEEIPASAVHWETDAPRAVLVRSGLVKVWEPGRYQVRASYGGVDAIAAIEVATRGRKLTVLPPLVILKRGEVHAFEARTEGGKVRARWSSSAPNVLATGNDGLFTAARPGHARACAQALEQEACAEVEVEP